MKVPLRGRHSDPAPVSPRTVLLVPLGDRASAASVRRAAALADGGPLAVLGLLKIHGYSFGMPNPGLMPTAKEREAQLQLVSDAIGRLEHLGCDADGQVAATRHPIRAIATVAKRRDVHHVVIDQPVLSRLRRSLEGDVAAGVRRRLGAAIDVVVTQSAATRVSRPLTRPTER